MRLRVSASDGAEMTFTVPGNFAPLVVKAIGERGWTGAVIHSRRSGQEVFTAVPGTFDADVDDSGETCESARAGDVIVATFPKYYRDSPPARVLPLGSPYLHVGFVYGEAFRWATPAGSEPPGVVIGHCETETTMEVLERLGERIRLNGSEQWTLRVEGVEGK